MEDASVKALARCHSRREEIETPHLSDPTPADGVIRFPHKGLLQMKNPLKTAVSPDMVLAWLFRKSDGAPKRVSLCVFQGRNPTSAPGRAAPGSLPARMN